MIGFTPQLSTSVWVGYDRDHLLSTADGQIAKRIWAQFTENALSDQEPASFTVPDGVVSVEMDPFTGMLATEDCPTHRVTYFLEGTEPTEPCPSPLEEETSSHEEQDHERENLIDRFFRWFGN